MALAWLAVTLTTSWLVPSGARADGLVDAVVVDVGRSTTDDLLGRTEVDSYRLGLQRFFRRNLWEGDRARLSGYFEASLNYWDGRDASLSALAFSPVLVFSWPTGNRVTPYLEAGIGASLLSRTHIGGRQFSTHFQFEDRIGIGVRGGRVDFHYRFMHYSNGGLEKPNNGIDFHVVGLTVDF